MKLLFTILVLIAGPFAWAQSCNCVEDSTLREFISCKPVLFDNHAKLYWSFNCDSSWLIFESAQKKKNILFSIEPYLTERLGHIYRQEYKSVFLVQHNVISGCCDPPLFYLYDKNNGQFKLDLGPVLFISEDKKLPFIVGLSDWCYANGNIDLTYKEYNFITVYNADKNKRYCIKLPKGRIDKIMKETEVTFPEQIFDTPELKGTVLTLSYWTDKPKTVTKKIIIDLNKYVR